jgi:hypothetical protein
MRRNGGADNTPRIPTCLYLFMAPSGSFSGDWKPYSGLAVATGFIKGAGYDRYEAILRGRGYTSSSFINDTNNAGYPTWRPVGEAILDFVGCFPYCCVGDAPPAELLQEVHRRQARWGVPFRTKFILVFLNYESINQKPDNNPAMAGMRDVVKDHLLRASAVNANTGHSYIDGSELLDVPATPPVGNYQGSNSDTIPPADNVKAGGTSGIHYWSARTNDPGFASDWRAEVEGFIVSRYGAPQSMIQGFMIDNVLGYPYYAFATNTALITPAFTPTDYINGNILMLAEMQDMVAAGGYSGPFAENMHWWANNGGFDASGVSTASYTWDLMPGRYGEFYWHRDGNPNESRSKLWTTLETDLRTQAAALRTDTSGTRRIIPSHSCKTSVANFTVPNGAGWSDVDRWALQANGPGTTANGEHGTYKQLRQLLAELRITDRFVVMNGRGSSKFFLFCNENLVSPDS